MTQTFDQWMAANTAPPENYSFAQYGRYLHGWRQSMPWAYKGMSVAYDAWAESRWNELQVLGEQAKDWAMLAWKYGLHSNYERLERGDKPLSAEVAADVVLSIPALILMGTAITLPILYDHTTDDRAE